MQGNAGRQFMRATAYGYPDDPREPSDQEKGLPQPPLQLDWDESAPAIELPPPAEITVPSTDLRTIIEQRRSVRTYADTPLTLNELAWLLWATQGVQEVGPGRTLRTVPSGGARHPFETVLSVNRVEGVPPGLWRYVAIGHKLVAWDLSTPDIADTITRHCMGQRFVSESAVMFIWICVPYRSVWRYQDRAYRGMHVDVGHVCQNLYLAAEGIGCGCCAIMAYGDPQMNGLVGLDGEEQFVIYVATVGKKKGDGPTAPPASS